MGLNLDEGSLHIGADFLFPIVALGPTVQWAIWPSVAHVFVWNGHDVELLGCDMPFMFKLTQVPIIPYVGPGFGLAIYDSVSPKFNVIGGAVFDLQGRVDLFAQIALRFVDGTFVDTAFGILVELD